MKKYYILLLVLIFALGIFSYRITLGFFSDTETSVNNTFTAASVFPTPTPTPTPIAQTLVINEVLPDTSCSQGETEAQWIEVYNGFSISINLKNFKISDGTNIIDLVSANSVTADPGEFVLLAHNGAIFGNNKCYQDNGAEVANLGGQLNIDTGHLQLLDASNNIIDDVQWGGSTGLNPAQNQSIEREPDGLDSATGSNFNASDFVVRPTPMPGL